MSKHCSIAQAFASLGDMCSLIVRGLLTRHPCLQWNIIGVVDSIRISSALPAYRTGWLQEVWNSFWRWRATIKCAKGRRNSNVHLCAGGCGGLPQVAWLKWLPQKIWKVWARNAETYSYMVKIVLQIVLFNNKLMFHCHFRVWNLCLIELRSYRILAEFQTLVYIN